MLPVGEKMRDGMTENCWLFDSERLQVGETSSLVKERVRGKCSKKKTEKKYGNGFKTIICFLVKILVQ